MVMIKELEMKRRNATTNKNQKKQTKKKKKKNHDELKMRQRACEGQVERE